MRLSRTMAIIASGALWLMIGLFLLVKGLNLVVLATQPDKFGVTALLTPYFAKWTGGREQSALLLITIGLLLGLIKGRFVLVNTVKRAVARISALPLPLKLSQVYSWRYLVLIACMMLLGMSLRWMHLPADVHGLIDVAVGSALINGAMVYFRLSAFAKQEETKF